MTSCCSAWMTLLLMSSPLYTINCILYTVYCTLYIVYTILCILCINNTMLNGANPTFLQNCSLYFATHFGFKIVHYFEEEKNIIFHFCTLNCKQYTLHCNTFLGPRGPLGTPSFVRPPARSYLNKIWR